MKYQFSKHYSLEQANALIPYIRQLFKELQALLGKDEQVLSEETFSHSSNGNGSTNGSSPADGVSLATNYAGWSDEKRNEAAYRLINALQTQGIVIQDVERGLIDFPSIKDGQEVFLCYELNDGASIEYFHSIDAGFAGRQKIRNSNDD